MCSRYLTRKGFFDILHARLVQFNRNPAKPALEMYVWRIRANEGRVLPLDLRAYEDCGVFAQIARNLRVADSSVGCIRSSPPFLGSNGRGLVTQSDRVVVRQAFSGHLTSATVISLSAKGRSLLDVIDLCSKIELIADYLSDAGTHRGCDM